MASVTDRLLSYVTFDTTSDEHSSSYPSTPGQLVFGKHLAKECEALGLADVTIDQYGYVTATLPATKDGLPVIAFLAHMDTCEAAPGKDVKPQVHKNYNGGDIVLGDLTLSPKEFPALKNYIGQTIITTDGTTLLGADDKAGIAEIMTAMEYLIAHPEIPHGKIRIGFTPDEEIGLGVEYFDVAAFGADFGYTIDGGAIGELEYESFEAAKAEITIQGKSVHPGTAKGVMKNAALIATELAALFPENETPATTEGYEGFYHLTEMKGTCGEAYLNYILRDFSKELLDKRKAKTQEIVQAIAEKHKVTIDLKITDQYRNMRVVLEERKEIMDLAKAAYADAGITPIIEPIRGGTDGSRLSFMGLPCPNIFDGGHNFHGMLEFIPVESMEKATEVIIGIVKKAVDFV